VAIYRDNERSILNREGRMRKRVISAVILVVFCKISIGETGFCSWQEKPASPASEQAKTRPDREEILEMMASISKVSPPARDSAIEKILKSGPDGKTPRSDFLYCLGAAYLGDVRAQICLGKAYEKGVGIVEDATDAFVWYSIALSGSISDQALEQEIRTARQRMTAILVQGYPAPSEEELNALVQKEQLRIREYQEQLRAEHKD